MTGKEKCKLLRQIRQEIADSNCIVYITTECTYEGDDCLGTCPKCDQEIAYLDAELKRKIAKGEDVTISGISLNTFQASVPVVKSSSEFIKPDGKALGNLLDDIGDMGFSVRTYNCLKRANITTVSDLILKSSSDLMKIRNMSEKSLDEIVKKLAEIGLSLKEEADVEEDPDLSLACGGFGFLRRDKDDNTESKSHDEVAKKLAELGLALKEDPEEKEDSTTPVACGDFAILDLDEGNATTPDLISSSPNDLTKVRDMGKKNLDEVIKKLSELGLSLAEDPAEQKEKTEPIACGGLVIFDRDEDDGEKLCMSIEELDLSGRSYNCLTRAGITTVGDLIDLTLEDLRQIKNLGKKNFDEIVTKIHNLGFGFLKEFKDSGDLGDLF